MRGNEYTELAAFATVAEYRSFTRAASSLRISPSTLSQSIRTLEQRLGVQLLNRTTRSVSLTEAGARLLARLVPAVAELQAAVDEARSTPDSLAGMVRVQVPWPAFYTVLEPLLGSFYQAHPSIVLDLTLEDAASDMVAGDFDVSIRLGELLEQDLVGMPLGGGVRQVAVWGDGSLSCSENALSIESLSYYGQKPSSGSERRNNNTFARRIACQMPRSRHHALSTALRAHG